MTEEQYYIELIKRIPLFRDSDIGIEPIMKGYSSDRKYRVSHEQRRYLVKLFDVKQQLAAKQEEYRVLTRLRQLEVQCSEPIDLGINACSDTDATTDEHKSIGYLVLSYIDGEEASERLPHYSSSVQYRIGQEAGRQLRSIHQINAPSVIQPWAERKLMKHRRYLERYSLLEHRLPDDNKLIAFIDQHAHLMQGRPNLLQHDDFHLSNLIVKDEQLAGVIDFDRMDWGDPIHEFLKVGFFSSAISIPFSIGQIRGYHDDQEPTEHFWKLYSLYVAMSLISSMVWITAVKPEEAEHMFKLCIRVMEDHHHFESIIPSWYTASQDY